MASATKRSELRRKKKARAQGKIRKRRNRRLGTRTLPMKKS